VYGLKATEHRVPTTGFFRPPQDAPRSLRILGSLGPMARDLGDLELVLRTIAGPDAADTDVPPVPLGDHQRRLFSGLRLAVAPTLPGLTVAPDLRAAVERTATQASDAGAGVVERLPAVDWRELGLFGELMTALTGVFDPGAQLSAEHRSLAWYLAALGRRDRFMTAWERFFDEVDALILPPALTTAFDHDATDHAEQGHLSVFANLAGLPALTVPAGLDGEGLPIGVQIVGPRWSEIRLLEIAGALEEAGILPGFARPPRY
jgi:amidase